MAMAETSWLDGGCLCGATRFSARPKDDDIHVCHCSKCRRWSAGPFFGLECGNDVRFAAEAPVAAFRSSDWAERVFCTKCGTPLVWRMHDGSHNIVSVEAFAGGAGGRRLAGEIFIDEKPAYYTLAADVPKLTGAEVFAEFQAAQETHNG
jgi:hypothetical protein